MKLVVILSLLLSIVLFNLMLPPLAKAGLSMHPLSQDERFQQAGFEPMALRSFISQIRLAAEQADAATIVSLVKFPIETGRKVYPTPESLICDFSQVFTADILQELKQIDESMISVTQKQGMIGGGTIWFAEEGGNIKIISIANWIVFKPYLEHAVQGPLRQNTFTITPPPKCSQN
jgi:hypothetical protein